MTTNVFVLGSEKIRVNIVQGLALRTGNAGQAVLQDNLIELDAALTKDQRDVVYVEELVHTIIARCGRDKLNDDHSFITPFATMLCQALKTGGGV